jgi:hypothetical protein
MQRCCIQFVFRRVIRIVLDSVGSGTLANIAHCPHLRLPNLCGLGLGNIKPIEGLPPAAEPAGNFRRNSSAASRAAGWAIRPPRAPKSLRNWVWRTCTPIPYRRVK